MIPGRLGRAATIWLSIVATAVAVPQVADARYPPRPGALWFAEPKPAWDPPVSVTASDPEAEIARGDQRMREQAHAEAGDAYASAWSQLDADARVSPLGQLLVQKSTDAYRLAAQSDPDPRLVQAPQALLHRFMHEAELQQATVLSALEAERSRLDALSSSVAPAPVAPADPVLAPSRDPAERSPPPPRIERAQEPRAADPAIPPPSRPRPGRTVGIALVSWGAACAVAGIAGIALGAPVEQRIHNRRDERLNSSEFLALSPAQQADYRAAYATYVAESQRVGRLRLGLGGAAMGMAAISLVVGTVLLVRARRSKTTLRAAIPR